ncbi:MAG: hypothetical protein ACP5GJ_02760 [Nanopusillaceae archaeon]|jgi:hypothetical protein
MSWTEKKKSIKEILRYLKDLKENEILRIKNYKEDRSIDIKKLNEYIYEINEHGFYLTNFRCTNNEIEKILNKLIKREFNTSYLLKLSKIKYENKSN